MSMKSGWKYFHGGFVGAFALAASIVMAVVSVAVAFVNGGEYLPTNHRDHPTRM